VEKTLNAMRSGCRDFKSANSYYLDGKPIQTMHFQELLSAAGNYSIKVFNPNDALLQQKKSP
jgi:Cu2+-exporting ATPase